jgi:hypothetical protein
MKYVITRWKKIGSRNMLFGLKRVFLPYLASRNVNVVSASVGADIPEEVKGSAPSAPKNGFANISYVVQFKNMEERNSFWRNIGSDAAFRKIWGIHPNPYSYLQTTSRFFRAVK